MHLDKRVERQERSSIVQCQLHHSHGTTSVEDNQTDRRSHCGKFPKHMLNLGFVSQIESCFLILEPKRLDRFRKIDDLGFVLAKLCFIYFPLIFLLYSKARTDPPRFPHLISNHKLICQILFLCVFYLTLNFVSPLFISSINKLIHWKKVSFHVLFCAQKNSSPFDQSFKLCAFSLLYVVPFTRDS